MARILDTTPQFREFADQAFLKAPAIRESLFKEVYADAHPEVFSVLTHRFGEGSLTALVRDLSRVRRRIEQAAPVVAEVVEEVDAAVAQALEADVESGPVHVLLVGPLATNAFVDHLDGDVAVFHCLEWYSGRDPARVLVAHEGTHAWHRLLVPDQPREEEDLLWTTFCEGLAIRVSRQIAPNQPEHHHFFYGIEGFEDWLPWCRENRDRLMARFLDAVEEGDDGEAFDLFFGAGFVEGRWRVGFFLADELLDSVEAPPRELARMSVEEGRTLVREAMGR